jgi:hypothetical protein
MSQTQHQPGDGPTTGTPVWVKVFGAMAILLILLFIGMHLTGLSPMGHGQ